MKYIAQESEEELVYHLTKNLINNNSYYIKKLQENYYYSYDNIVWQRVFVPSKPNDETIIENKKVVFYQGFRPVGLGKKNKGDLLTAMPGKIVKVNVKVGDSVKANQTIIIMEAMKMENEIKSSIDGVVTQIFVAENQLVESNVQLMEIKANV